MTLAPGVRSDRVDIGGNGVGLDLVAAHVGSRARAADRIHECEHFGGLVSLAEGGKGCHRPRGGVVVLAAVLPNAGRIALDVPGIKRCSIEGRREQQSQAFVATDELLVRGGHAAQGPRRVRRAGDHAPGLRNRIDPAFIAR